MKRVFASLVVCLALLGLTQFASAGPERFDGKEAKAMTQPILEQPCNWTGFYIGAHVGYGWGDLNWQDVGEASDSSSNEGIDTLVDQHQEGVFGGGQLGYNYQIGSWFVIGAEGDFSYSDVSANDKLDVADEPNVFDTRNNWVINLAGRAGVTLHHFLIYAKGGVSFARLEYRWDHTDLNAVDGDNEGDHVDTFRTDEWRTAPMVGGGVEYAFNCHWSAKVEYNHLFLGSESIHGTRIDNGIPEPENYVVDVDQSSVQVGLNYKF